MPKLEIPALGLPAVEIPDEVARPLYAGVGAADAVVGYVRDAVTDLQHRFADVQTRVADLDLDPAALRDQAVTAVSAQLDALSKDAHERREAIERRVADLRAEAAGIQDTVTAAYADLAKRGQALVDRVAQGTAEVDD